MKVNIYKTSQQKKTNGLKVSVIIPNYNYEDFIIERIDSILFQTYPIHEIIILDDCSTDNSVKVIEDKISKIKDVKIKFISNKKNSGSVFSQWQLGLKNITGDYFWIAEADDSCDNTFLENVMGQFENDEDVVLSYAESKKIDENNNIIDNDCRDWADIYNIHRWDKTYVSTGKKEIEESISYNNSILNVSSLVWKYNKNYYDIFEQAKDYKVAGDWYIYLQVLKKGKIAYNENSLNYFRKHSKSVSTVVKRNIEYSEVLKIQNDALNFCNYDKKVEQRQIGRRKLMGFVEDEKNKNKRGVVAWFVPGLLKGSGGHRTIFQNINALIKEGYKCDVYIGDDESISPMRLKSEVSQFYGECHADMFAGWNPVKKYDVVVATAFNTVEPVMKVDCNKKLYFVQDYEPMFFPMGDLYIQAENTYKNDISVISIGKWLSAKMQNEFNLKSTYFSFCADLGVYKKLKNIKKEKALCFIFQPNKPRRCDHLALEALQIVKQIEPDLKIYVYGSEGFEIKNLDVENLGIIPVDECNKLYNKCMVGLCMSASNPSRIPFEMMAAGLPVVELYRENNLYDFPNEGCLLSETTKESIATAILRVLHDKELQKSMSNSGIKFMKKYSLEFGYKEFINNFNLFVNSNKFGKNKIKKMYTNKPVVADCTINKVASINMKPISIINNNVSNKDAIITRGLRKIKRIIKRIIRR